MALRLSIPALLGFVFISACSKEPTCQVKSGNEGIITENVNELEDLCFEPTEKQFLIRSDSEYTAIFQRSQASSNCQSKPLPSIDFTKNSLLICRVMVGGCDAGMLRRAERDDANKKITYSVEASTCGNCQMAMASNNIVLIPKVPDDFTVEFEVVKK